MTATTNAIRPNEITVTKCGTYYNGGHDYSVTFVLDYATITVSIEHDEDTDDNDNDNGIEERVAAVAADILSGYYGIHVAVES